ncbi:hypothetical protein BLNAU_1679 [Blattamonas nauphoetae]|uniref:DNA repair metallo-beta-lactamase domain-containing protein n=1 Tax=Blattamonas nauphoetae TaxID=2049346 RepID=A0ABQ9YHB1_9EUKA|nr:hypothetical protein BLNAU_1679 [Blattamonas nauphoetae]
MKVRPDAVVALPMNTPCYIENTRLTLIDANHCPGAAIFIFEIFDLDVPPEYKYQKNDSFSDDSVQETGESNTSPPSSSQNDSTDFSSFVAAFGSSQPKVNHDPLPARQTTRFTRGTQPVVIMPEPFFTLEPPPFYFSANSDGKQTMPPVARIIVHTGDFRYTPRIGQELRTICGDRGIDELYLDTTYSSPQYLFPTHAQTVYAMTREILQDEMSVLEQMQRGVIQSNGISPLPLIMIGTYTIGKEKFYKEIGHLLQRYSPLVKIGLKRKMHVQTRKAELLKLMGEWDDDLFTEDPSETNIRIVGFQDLSVKGMKDKLDVEMVVRGKEIKEERLSQGLQTPNSDSSDMKLLNAKIAKCERFGVFTGGEKARPYFGYRRVWGVSASGWELKLKGRELPVVTLGMMKEWEQGWEYDTKIKDTKREPNSLLPTMAGVGSEERKTIQKDNEEEDDDWKKEDDEIVYRGSESQEEDNDDDDSKPGTGLTPLLNRTEITTSSPVHPSEDRLSLPRRGHSLPSSSPPSVRSISSAITHSATIPFQSSQSADAVLPPCSSLFIPVVLPNMKTWGASTHFGLAYSEHSSFNELVFFLASHKIGTIIPTVHGEEKKVTKEKEDNRGGRWKASSDTQHPSSVIVRILREGVERLEQERRMVDYVRTQQHRSGTRTQETPTSRINEKSGQDLMDSFLSLGEQTRLTFNSSPHVHPSVKTAASMPLSPPTASQSAFISMQSLRKLGAREKEHKARKREFHEKKEDDTLGEDLSEKSEENAIDFNSRDRSKQQNTDAQMPPLDAKRDEELNTQVVDDQTLFTSSYAHPSLLTYSTSSSSILSSRSPLSSNFQASFGQPSSSFSGFDSTVFEELGMSPKEIARQKHMYFQTQARAKKTGDGSNQEKIEKTKRTSSAKH